MKVTWEQARIRILEALLYCTLDFRFNADSTDSKIMSVGFKFSRKEIGSMLHQSQIQFCIHIAMR